MQPNPHTDVEKSQRQKFKGLGRISYEKTQKKDSHVVGCVNIFYLITYSLVGFDPMYIVGCD